MLTEYITNPVLFVILMTGALTLIVLEFFVPSFGLLGISGAYLTIESILAIKNIENAILYIAISLVITFVIMMIFTKSFLKNMDKNKIVLNTDLSKSKGNGPKYDITNLMGKTGLVNKTLRPYGEVEIEGKVYVATSFGNYIDKGKMIKVEKVEGSTIYCIEIV